MRKLYFFAFILLAGLSPAYAQHEEDNITVAYQSDMADWNLDNYLSGNPWQIWSQEDPDDLWGMPENITEKTGCTDGIFCRYDSSEDSDAWAISPAIKLKENIEYRISVWVMDQGSDNFFIDENEENWKLCVGTEDNVVALKNGVTLINQRGFNNGRNLTRYSKYFTPEASGEYYFGLNCFSEKDQYGVAATGFVISYEDDLTAIQIIENSTDYPVEYFDLTGRKLSQPSKGTICIKKQGNKSYKVTF